MWIWSNTTGNLTRDGQFITWGYAGHAQGTNNPSDEALPDTGPPPEGAYTIGPARTDPHLGTIAMPLTPDPTTDMHGRSGFWIHGASPQHPLESSHGCIVLPSVARSTIATSGDTVLLVTA